MWAKNTVVYFFSWITYQNIFLHDWLLGACSFRQFDTEFLLVLQVLSHCWSKYPQFRNKDDSFLGMPQRFQSKESVWVCRRALNHPVVTVLSSSLFLSMWVCELGLAACATTCMVAAAVCEPERGLPCVKLVGSNHICYSKRSSSWIYKLM